MTPHGRVRISILLVKRAALVTLILLLAGCHKGGSPRLEGKWRGAKAEGILPASQAAANQFAMDTEVEFAGNQVTVRTPSSKQADKYKVVREDKRSIMIQTDKDGPNDLQTFTFDTERAMRWQILPGMTVSFLKE